MLLKELRDELCKYKEDDLKNIICELYKSIPKTHREEKDIDNLIKDYTAYKSVGKIDKKKDLSLETLKPQVEQFINYAYKQYYYAPNQFVHKKERPKWRFMVKNYIKSLESIQPLSENGKTATDLLKELYELLSYACVYWTFSTDNPFNSVGIMQTEFLNKVIKRMLVEGTNTRSIRSILLLIINSNVDCITLHTELIAVLISNLKTTDAREMAINQCKLLSDESDEKWKSTNKKSSSYSDSIFRYNERMNIITKTIFYIHCELCEYDDAIMYFHKKYIELSKEVSLYILLELLYEYNLKEYWIREYEKAVSVGIKPREGLQNAYKYLKKNGEFNQEDY